MCCQIKSKCKNCGQKFEVTLLRAKMHGKGMCGHCKKLVLSAKH